MNYFIPVTLVISELEQRAYWIASMIENIEYVSSRYSAAEYSKSQWESSAYKSWTLLRWAYPKNYVVVLSLKSWNAMEILLTAWILGASRFNSTIIPYLWGSVPNFVSGLLSQSGRSPFLCISFSHIQMVSLSSFVWHSRASTWKLLKKK